MSEITLTDLKRLLGENGVISAESVFSSPKQIIPTTPAVDVGLHGGIPEGSTVIFSGVPKAGKTTLTLHFMANAQQDEYGGRNCYYVDAEGRIKEMNLACVPHLKKEKLQIIRSHRNKEGSIEVLTAEKILDAVISILRNDPKSVICIDSLARLCTENETILSMGDSGKRAGVPSILEKFFRQASQIIPVNNNILILITHIMANPSGMGKSTTEKGGYGKDYQADVRLEAKWVEKVKLGDKDENNKIIGQICHWVATCTALGSPHQEISMRIKYGDGIDIVGELIDLGLSFGLLERKGAWYRIPFLNEEDLKFQGAQNLYNYLEQNKETRDKLAQSIKNITT